MNINIREFWSRFRYILLTHGILIVQLLLTISEFALTFNNWHTALCLNDFNSINQLTLILVFVSILLFMFILIQLCIIFKRPK